MTDVGKIGVSSDAKDIHVGIHSSFQKEQYDCHRIHNVQMCVCV
jgi:hypothetical protein